MLFGQGPEKGIEHPELSDLMRQGEWMIKEGKKIRDAEEVRIRAESADPNFVHKEVLELYIGVKSSIKVKQQFVFSLMGEKSTKEYAKILDDQFRDIDKLKEQQVRLLEILSRLPSQKSDATPTR